MTRACIVSWADHSDPAKTSRTGPAENAPTGTCRAGCQEGNHISGLVDQHISFGEAAAGLMMRVELSQG